MTRENGHAAVRPQEWAHSRRVRPCFLSPTGQQRGNSMAADRKFDIQVVLDGLGQGVLIFSNDGRLVLDNLAARTILSTDINIIRDEGWTATEVLFNTRLDNPDESLAAVRARALESSRPVRFHIFRSGEYIPCWAAPIQDGAGNGHIMITLEQPDWTAMAQLVDRFRKEMGEAIDSTQGHIDLINQTIKVHDPEADVGTLTKRITGFTRLISIHMHRTGRLIQMLQRLEDIRIGRVHDQTRTTRRRINLAEFIEDFVEELDEIDLVDPETEAQDHRARLTTHIPDDIDLHVASRYLTQILRDILRNSIMYSLLGTPIRIEAHTKTRQIQIDVIDEGYGVREKEVERVFLPFQRARQPQIIGEFGYGLSLYLCKHEVEAMDGRTWFKSDEGVGTTFSFTLPLWSEEPETESGKTTGTAPDSHTADTVVSAAFKPTTVSDSDKKDKSPASKEKSSSGKKDSE